MISWRDRLNITLLFCHASCVAIVLVAIVGCGKPSAPPKTVAPSSPPVEKVAAEATHSHAKVTSAVDSQIAAITQLVENVPDDLEPSSDAAPEKYPKEHRERMALLTPGGPVLVDVWLTVDGRPHIGAFNELVQQVLDAADTNDDDRATWKELAGNETFIASQRPNQPKVSPAELKMWTDTFDTNRDAQLQSAEAAAWLGRDAGTTARAFAVRSSRAYFSVPSAGSRIWQLLDADRNGALSANELESASEKLWTLDANDDRVLSVRELATLREQLEAQANRTAPRPDTARYAAIHFEPDITADRLDYLLSDLYAPRQTLGPSSFGELAALYERIDANGDNWLEQIELADMVTMKPQLELAITFNRSSEGGEASAAIEIRTHAPELTVAAQPSADRIVLALGSTRLIISAHDLVADDASRPGGRTSPTQLRLMVHDECDSLFEELDENADGKLGEREVASCPTRLLNRDSSGDGQLAASELRYAMIVAFLRGEPPTEQSFYVPTSTISPKVDEKAPAWFKSADFNGDGHISRREFLGTPEKFSLLDRDTDGFISSAEAAAFSVHSAILNFKSKSSATSLERHSLGTTPPTLPARFRH